MLSEVVKNLSNEKLGKYLRNGIKTIIDEKDDLTLYEETIRGINIIIAKGMENEN